jgi:hypothetical protein
MPDPIKIRIEGDELVELKRHADDFSECLGLPRRIQKYRGVNLSQETTDSGSQ